MVSEKFAQIKIIAEQQLVINNELAMQRAEFHQNHTYIFEERTELAQERILTAQERTLIALIPTSLSIDLSEK